MKFAVNQNKNADSTIASKAKKRQARKRKISAMLSVILFLHDICNPFKIMNFNIGQAVYAKRLHNRNPSKGTCAEKICDFFEKKGNLILIYLYSHTLYLFNID